MARINGLDKLSYADLAELKTRVEAAMAARKAADAHAVKLQMQELAAASGFSVSELFGDKRSARKGAASAVKYRNPKDPTQTWTGRGRKPNWLVEATRKGAKLESFEA
ncbi:MAG: H-NS family nucleoid-associated regulatory protein [Hyphomicrobiaceae bacterium]